MKSLSKCALLLTLLFSVAGFFLRYSQLSHELLEGGFLAEGSFLHIVLFALTAVLLLTLIFLLRPLKQRGEFRQIFAPKTLPCGLMLLASVGLLAGSLLLWVLGGTSVSVNSLNAPGVVLLLQKLLAPLGIAAAGCIAAFAICCLYRKKPSALLLMVASLYLVVRLILHFQSWNTDPSIHDYCYQLLAAICTMLGVFQLAGFSFDRGKRRISLYWCLCAVFFCSITVADTLHELNWPELLSNLSLLLLALSGAAFLLTARGSSSGHASAEQ